VLTTAAEMEGTSPDTVLREIAEHVPAPR